MRVALSVRPSDHGGERYYVVKEGEPLIEAIARLIATDRIEQKNECPGRPVR
jgi:hypothetical protein